MEKDMSLVIAQLMAREDFVHYSDPRDIMLIMNTLTELNETDMLKKACGNDIMRAFGSGITLDRNTRTALIGSVLCGKFQLLLILAKKFPTWLITEV